MFLKKIAFFCLLLVFYTEDDTEEVTTGAVKLAEREKKQDPVGPREDFIPDPCPAADMKQCLSLNDTDDMDDMKYNDTEKVTTEAEEGKKLSENILTKLDHFKQPDSVGLTGNFIPNPCPEADMKQCLSLNDTDDMDDMMYDDTEDVTIEAVKLTEGEKKLSEHILAMLDHFKQPDPVGLPGDFIPDPCPIEDMKHSFTLGTLYLKNTALYGHNKLRILSVNVEIENMEVQVAVSIDALQARGNYSFLKIFSSSHGPFTVNVTGIKLLAKATVAVERDGKLRTQDVHADVSFNTINTNFQNLGILGGIFQNFINSGGYSIFASSIPTILEETYPKVRAEINKKLEEVADDLIFPNSISPLDMVVIDVRKKIRSMRLDPFQFKDYNTTVSLFTIVLSNTRVIGMSSLQRVGNTSLKMENNTVVADFKVGTQKLEGRTQWELLTGFMSRAGVASFSVEFISVRVVLAQPLDTEKTPILRHLDLDIGNIQVRSNGAGTMDYAIEFGVNVLPNLLRYQIMDALENLLKERMQQELKTLNVDKMIKQELPKLIRMKESGLKLLNLRNSTTENEIFDEDEFFNF